MQLVSLSKLNTVCSSSLRRVLVGQGKSREGGLVARLGFEGQVSNHGCKSVRSFSSHQINQYLVKPTVASLSCVARSRMAASGSQGSQAVSGDLYGDALFMGCGGGVIDHGKPTAVFFGDRSVRSCRKASISLKSRDASFIRLGAPGIARRSLESKRFIGQCLRHYHASSASFSDGAAAHVDILGRDATIESSADTPDSKHVVQRISKLHSGSCYLPHPDKVKTGGEDAHFICEEKNVIGVADGVGGWADVGVDAGIYARLLMSNSMTAILEDSKDGVDPAKVLEKAHANTQVIGSSTACIIALTDQGIHAINLGDSGFIVIRDGSTVFRSPAQQYGFNFPYQLASGTGGDLPSSGQVFTFPVASGDILVTGTDGLFDNLYDNEIAALVVQAKRSGLEPQATAQNIAMLAQQKALDHQRKSPFAQAAHDAGFRYIGGKLDDITVVVSYITAEDNQ